MKYINISLFDFVLLIIILLALWNLDVCITTLNLGVVGNGFFYVRPDVMYHVDLYIILLSVVVLIFKKDSDGGK